MTRRRRGSLLSLACATLLLGGAALAWACVPGSYLWAEPQFAPPGGTVTIHGQEFESASVEIRWGSQSGPVLAVASSSSFAQAVSIPSSAAEGIYLVFAVASNGETNRTPVEVTNSPAASSWGDGGWAQRPTDPGARTPAPSSNPATGETPTPTPAPPAGSPRVVGEVAPALVPLGAIAPATGDAPGRQGATDRGSNLAAERPPAGAPAQRFYDVSPLPGRYFGNPNGAPAAASFVQPAAAYSQVGRGSSGQRHPSEASAVGDLWDGFADGTTPSLNGGSELPASGPRSTLAVGLGLLALGLLTLVGGLAVAETRRGRVRV